VAKTCPYCRGVIAEEEAKLCASCGTPHHRECYAENQGCTVFGCEKSPSEEAKIDLSSLGSEEMPPPLPLDSTPPPPSASRYLIYRNGETTGPFDLSHLQTSYSAGHLATGDLTWKEGMPSWIPVSQLLGIVPLTASQGQTAAEKPTFIVKPRSHLAGAILATLLCCMPFGIVAIIYAAQVDSKFNAGDYVGAQNASNTAKTWLVVSIVLGLLFGFLVMLGSAS
jgi:hypothetical protein